MKSHQLHPRYLTAGLIVWFVNCLVFSTAHAGPIYTLGKHITGWQETTYTFNSMFSGYAVFGVSNVNSSDNSKLVLDKITGSDTSIFFPDGTTNLGFEDVDFSGFGSSDTDGNTDDGSVSLVDNNTSNGVFDATFNDVRDVNNNYIGTVDVLPIDGTYAAFLDSFGENTSGFQNENDTSGTTGSYLYLELDADSGDSFTFNWNFFSDESFDVALSEGDFAFFRLVDRNDPLDTTSPIHHETLAQVGVVPLPPAVWLFGSGMIALVGIARRNA